MLFIKRHYFCSLFTDCLSRIQHHRFVHLLVVCVCVGDGGGGYVWV